MSPRYVILEHTYQGVHFDLMLEVDGTLRTWRLGSPPESGQSALAESSFAHRLLYLEYEGPISGDRGQVRRWDHGTYAGDPHGETELVIELTGQRLRGRLELQRRTDGLWDLRYSAGASSELN